MAYGFSQIEAIVAGKHGMVTGAGRHGTEAEKEAGWKFSLESKALCCDPRSQSLECK